MVVEAYRAYSTALAGLACDGSGKSLGSRLWDGGLLAMPRSEAVMLLCVLDSRDSTSEAAGRIQAGGTLGNFTPAVLPVESLGR